MRETCAPPKERFASSAAVLARERHALRDALIDDVDADLRQAVDVGFAGAEVAAFDGVVEEAVNAVAVVLIILGGVDAALRGDGVRAAGRILEAEALYVVAELGQGGGGRGACQSRADDDDVVLALVRRIHQLHIELGPFPRRLDRTRRNSGVKCHTMSRPGRKPARIAMGTAMNPRTMMNVTILAERPQLRRITRVRSAERLEHAPEAVVKVHSEQHNRDDVGHRDDGIREAG